MTERIERSLGQLAAGSVDLACRCPLLTVSLCLALTVVTAFVAATRLAVDTDPALFTSPQLEFRRTNAALQAAFPDLQGNLVVLVEADDARDAREAAEELVTLLRQDPKWFGYVFLPGEDPFFEANGLFYVERDELTRLSARLEESGPLLTTLAENHDLATFLGAVAHGVSGGEGLAALGEDGGRILDHVSLAIERFGRGEHAPIDWDTLLLEDLDASPLDPQVVFVQPNTDVSHLSPALASFARVRERAAQLPGRPGLRVRVTGDRVVHTEETSLVLGEAWLAGAISLLLVTGILFYSLQSFRLLLATILTLLVGLVWTAGFAGVAVGRLNVLTTAFAVLYIGLGVDFGIHFALGYLEDRRRGLAPHDALHSTGRRVGASLLFCASTTAIGFYAFIPTSYRGVAELGIISGTGVFLSLVATLTFYPALIYLGMGESPKLLTSRGSTRQLRLPHFPLRHSRGICVGAVLLLVVCAAAVPFVRFDMDPLNVRDPRVESVQAMKDLLVDGEISAWTIEALAEDLDAARAVAKRIEALPGIQEVHTLESFLPDDAEERLPVFARMRDALSSPIELKDEADADPARALEWMIEEYGVALDIDGQLRADVDTPVVEQAERLRTALAALDRRLVDGEIGAAELDALDADAFGGLPEAIEDILEALPERPLTLEDLPDSLVRRYVAPSGVARIEVFAKGNLHRPGALEAFADEVLSVEPAAGGAVVATVEFGRAITRSLFEALVTATLVITLLLILLWRSLAYTLITLAPLLVGGLSTAAFMVAVDIPFNFANVIVLPLILGIGVDSGIHLVHRHRTGLYGADSLLETGAAQGVLFSALTTLVSFSTLAFSHHLGIASLAQLLVVGIGFMLVANLIVLPALLTWIDAKG